MSTLRHIGSVVTAHGNKLPATVFNVDRQSNDPAWFGLWMHAKTGRAKDCLGGYRHAREPFGEFHCVDHYGRIGPYVTFEPYDTAMGPEEWHGLLEFCERIGLDVYISPASAWNPTRTILIVVWPKDKPGIRENPIWDGKLTAEERKQLRRECKRFEESWKGDKAEE